MAEIQNIIPLAQRGKLETLEEKARYIRRLTLDMIYHAKRGHIGGSLSCVDILVALYYSVMRKEDKFILSKGHACVPLYAILADKGYIPIEDLNTFNQKGSYLEGHPNNKIPGILATTGSLGHGLGIGAGLAMTTTGRVFVLMGDGECQEGSVWEAARFASEHQLNNLIGIIDYNGLEATNHLVYGNPAEKFIAFGWEVREVQGHSIPILIGQIKRINNHPMAIIAHTVKGMGISFMKNKIEWHHRIPNEEEYKLAYQELRQ